MMPPRKQLEKRIGRPPVVIDLTILAKFAELQASYKQMAAAFKCSERTIMERMKEPDFQEAYEQGKQQGKLNLKQLQWQHANGTGSAAVNMTIHLSKHWLGEIDNVPGTIIQNTNTTHVDVSVAREKLAAKFNALSERIQGRVVELADGSGAKLVSQKPVADGD